MGLGHCSVLDVLDRASACFLGSTFFPGHVCRLVDRRPTVMAFPALLESGCDLGEGTISRKTNPLCLPAFFRDSVLGWIAAFATRDFTIPEIWVVNAARAAGGEIAPFTMSGIISSAGTLFGLLAGVAWTVSRGGWQVSGPVWKRVVRYVIGLLGVLVIWYGLGLVFPRGEAFVPSAFRFIRYSLLGGWVSAGAPQFFTKLKLS
jgi:hypothetical protein